MEERERRIGLNEALFREVNERIERVSGALQTGTGTIAILCECGNETCVEHIEVSVSEYERIRSDSLLYVIATGHEIPDAEEVVERGDGWEVVRKGGVASEVAEETDPRS